MFPLPHWLAHAIPKGGTAIAWLLGLIILILCGIALPAVWSRHHFRRQAAYDVLWLLITRGRRRRARPEPRTPTCLPGPRRPGDDTVPTLTALPPSPQPPALPPSTSGDPTPPPQAGENPPHAVQRRHGHRSKAM